MILKIMAMSTPELLDMNRAFLNNGFDNGEQLSMHVIQIFEKIHPPNVLVLLLKMIYTLKML